jgi:hypothetical protein
MIKKQQFMTYKNPLSTFNLLLLFTNTIKEMHYIELINGDSFIFQYTI